MSRRFAAVAVLALAFAAPAAAQPNVVLIVTDDQRADTLDAMPTVQAKLAGKGVAFSNAFVVNPLCCPSRASILTGLYAHTHGIYQQVSSSPHVARRFDDRETIATWLDRAGYETSLVGKYLNGYDATWRPRGWDRITAMLNPAGYYNYRLSRDGVVQEYGDAPEDYSTDVLAGEAVAFIEQANSPFFLYFAPVAPHTTANGGNPDIPPARAMVETGKPAWLQRMAALDAPRLSGMSDLAQAQRAAVGGADRAVRAIFEAVEARGEIADTLFVLTSDNGLTWGEHGLAARKNVPYEPSIRVPLVVRFDGRLPTATESRIVANIDLAPTIAEAVDVPVPARTEGKSLFRLFDGSPWRTALLVEHVGRSIPTYCAIRTETEKYVVYADGSRELYDLQTDPDELFNVRDPEHRYDLRTALGRLCRPKPSGFVWPPVCFRFGDRLANRIVGKPWFEVICARRGNDRVLVRDGRRDVVFCGPGHDQVTADVVDEIRSDCERVQRR